MESSATSKLASSSISSCRILKHCLLTFNVSFSTHFQLMEYFDHGQTELSNICIALQCCFILVGRNMC